MEGTYNKLKSEINKRTFQQVWSMDVKQQIESVFLQCQIYWTMHEQYEYLKKVQENLQNRLLSEAEYEPDGELTTLDCMIIVELWRHYKTVNEIGGIWDCFIDGYPDQGSKGVSIFFKNYLLKDWEATKLELVKAGLSDKVMEDIEFTRNALAATKAIDETLCMNKITVDRKIKYLDMLEQALCMQPISIEESVDAVLSQYTENKIIALLRQNDINSDIELYMQLGMLRGVLTDENIRNEIERPWVKKAKYFTDKCTISSVPLMEAVNGILKKYISEDHDPKIDEMEQLLEEGYTSENKVLQKELYQKLVKECKRWIEKYRVEWEQISNEPTLLELQYKLEVADKRRVPYDVEQKAISDIRDTLDKMEREEPDWNTLIKASRKHREKK